MNDITCYYVYYLSPWFAHLPCAGSSIYVIGYSFRIQQASKGIYNLLD